MSKEEFIKKIQMLNIGQGFEFSSPESKSFEMSIQCTEVINVICTIVGGFDRTPRIFDDRFYKINEMLDECSDMFREAEVDINDIFITGEFSCR